VGLYLHGSLATGRWRPGSDVDLLAVVSAPEDEAVVEEVAASVDVPAPMELRVWPSDRPDRDLPVHRTAVAAAGVALHGPPAAEVVEPPPWEDFLTVLVEDLDAAADAGLAAADPTTAVLTVCRGLATLSSPPGTLFGKEEAGEWALERLPAEHRPLVAAALAARRDPATPIEWNPEALRRFRIFAVGTAVRRRPGRKVAGLP
jgi:streptomycin 3"-adenylyltransferase